MGAHSPFALPLSACNHNLEIFPSLMSKSERVVLSCYDRVALGGELLLFDHPDARPVASSTNGGGSSTKIPAPPTAEFAVEELQAGLRDKGKQAQEVNMPVVL